MWSAYAENCGSDLLAARLQHLTASGASDYRIAAKSADRYAAYARSRLGLDRDDEPLPLLGVHLSSPADASPSCSGFRDGANEVGLIVNGPQRPNPATGSRRQDVRYGRSLARVGHRL